MKKTLCIMFFVFNLCFSGNAISFTHSDYAEKQKTKEYFFIVAPLAGGINSEVKSHQAVPTSTGIKVVPATLKDNGLYSGLFLLFRHQCGLTITDNVFYADVNEADISLNVLHADFIWHKENTFTPYLGGGYVYHKINTEGGDIKISAPLGELGLHINVNSSFRFIPFAGYSREDVVTPGSDNTYDAFLYGVKAYVSYGRGFRAAIKVYQEDLKDKDTYLTAKVRIMQAFSPNWGIVLRAEYAEHITDKSYSAVAGPFFRF